MAEKKYVGSEAFIRLVAQIKAGFASLTHTHKLEDITDYKVDTALSSTSANPVQNKAIKAEFQAVQDELDSLAEQLGTTDLSGLETKSDAAAKLTEAKSYTDSEVAKVTSGTVVVKEAEHADSADSATTAANATNAQNANHAATADSATTANTATSATTATKATQDASGNVITSTYETKTDASAKLDEAKQYADTQIAALVDSAPETLDTLGELAAAINENADVVTALNDAIANKADKEHVHSWNDLTDRPFGEIIESRTLELTDDEDGSYHSNGITHNASFSCDSVSVTFDGETKTFNGFSISTGLSSPRTIASDDNYQVYIDNSWVYEDLFSMGCWAETTDYSSGHEITVSFNNETMAQLDEKYIPDTIARKQEVDEALDGKADKATTLSGYGITDAYTKTQVDSALSGKQAAGNYATKATTLAGYGIADAYTKTQIDATVSDLEDTIDGKSDTGHGHAISDVSGLQSALDGKAASSHGNHVPATQTADNTKFLRNDNTWATVTPSNIGAYTKSEVDTALGKKADSSSLTSHTGNGDIHVTATQKTNWNTAYSHSQDAHKYAGSSSKGGAANSVANSMTIKLNGGSTEGTNLFTYNGSGAKTINITPASIGAQASGDYAAASHTHDGRYYTESEIDSKVSALNSALSGKAASSHTHSISDISGLEARLAAIEAMLISITDTEIDEICE